MHWGDHIEPGFVTEFGNETFNIIHDGGYVKGLFIYLHIAHLS